MKFRGYNAQPKVEQDQVGALIDRCPCREENLWTGPGGSLWGSSHLDCVLLHASVLAGVAEASHANCAVVRPTHSGSGSGLTVAVAWRWQFVTE